MCDCCNIGSVGMATAEIFSPPMRYMQGGERMPGDDGDGLRGRRAYDLGNPVSGHRDLALWAPENLKGSQQRVRRCLSK